jgi:hypothetical protein
VWLRAAAAGLVLACAACGSTTETEKTGSTRAPAVVATSAPSATTTRATTTTTRATTTTTSPASECKVAPHALTELVRAGLAFPGPAKLERARLVGGPGAYYFAARIVPPGKRASVGTGVWAASSRSPKNGVVAVNKTAGSFSDFRRADTPLSAAARRWVARSLRCVG